MTPLDLERIVTLLDRQMQRATYGAVAQLLGVPQQSLMKDLPRNHRYSWIVNSKTKMPTRYAESEIHPALIVRMGVIEDREELEKWVGEQR